ncbi:Flp pilus assembly protein CpaB [Adhaeretor mobilis]|uniref:SAF domain-containing protein n=1 Tax=Adhaeretor mobilis TaxID=1930276 RepID=A0A517MVR7_9BACT|nr:Flp pilus assembly protein CpaB [Adhaeretor mobilis]QDS98972.1 hypothetical protein HG15A2_22610 [Adhaeretor mobilis]
MRPKSLVLLALALGCGLVASIGISQVLDSNGKPAQVETVPIYVAVQTVNLGDPIDETLVTLEEWPKEKVPVGAIAAWEDLEDRRPRATILQGAPILDSHLLAKGQHIDTLGAIPADMRIKTISVDARRSAAGLILPGNRVDLQIFISRNEREGIFTPRTKVFLQNIRVFAVDQKVERSADGEESRTIAKTVSLVVTPKQANTITLAENLGDVSLIPRNADDEAIISDNEVDIDSLLGRSTSNNREMERSTVEAIVPSIEDMQSSMAPVKPPFSMTIIYPDEVSKIEFTAAGDPILSGNNSALLPPPIGAPIEDSEPIENDADADFPIDLRIK